MEPITREKMIELLNMAACPAIFGTGVIVRDELHGEIEQCQFCYERDQAIAALQAAEPVGTLKVREGWGIHKSRTLYDLVELDVGDYPLFTLSCPPDKAQVPEGYAAVPLDPRNGRPRITSEMKAEHIGEYSWEEDAPYYDEDGELIEHTASHVVPWDLCKKIYAGMAQTALLTASPAKAQVPEGWRDELTKIRDVIAAAPIDALGTGEATDCAPWSIRDEVVDGLTRLLTASPAPERSAKRHNWDDAGERCLDCGDRDWFAGPVCEGKQEEVE